MVNVLDVAEDANVSSTTVSRVLASSPLVRAKTRAKVIAATEALGYHPNSFARNLRRGRGSSVALVTGDIEHGIYPGLAKHLQLELEQIDLNLVLFNLGHQQERLRHVLEQAAAMGLRGLFLASADIADVVGLKPLVDRAIAKGVAILSVSQRLERFVSARLCMTTGKVLGWRSSTWLHAAGTGSPISVTSAVRRLAASALSVTRKALAGPVCRSIPPWSGMCEMAFAARSATG